MPSNTDLLIDFSPRQIRRQDDFHRRVRPWSLASYTVSLVVPVALAITPLGVAVIDYFGPRLWTRVVFGTVVLLLLGRLATLGCAWVIRRAQQQVGLATGSAQLWISDVIKSFVLSAGIAVAAVSGLLLLTNTWPASWWWIASVCAAALVIVLSFLFPLVVEPLFNRFTALPEGELRQDLFDLAQRDGVVVSEVLVADASRRTTAVNAYVSGLGASRRIVVFDTLIAQGNQRVRLVVAHELGHVVAHDVLVGTALAALGAAAAVIALAVLLTSDWATVHGVVSITDPSMIPVLFAGVVLLSAIATPFQSGVSRHIERRADRHALQLTENDGTPGESAWQFADMHRMLAVTNVGALRPPAVLHAWFGSHPTTVQRIAATRQWASARGLPVPGPLADSGHN